MKCKFRTPRPVCRRFLFDDGFWVEEYEPLFAFIKGIWERRNEEILAGFDVVCATSFLDGYGLKISFKKIKNKSTNRIQHIKNIVTFIVHSLNNDVDLKKYIQINCCISIT